MNHSHRWFWFRIPIMFLVLTTKHKYRKIVTLIKSGLCMSSEKAMAPHSSTLAWKIPWTEEPGRLQSVGSLRLRHDWATSLSLFTFMNWEGNGNPLQCSFLENPRDGGAWWAAVSGVTQSRTWLSGLARMHLQSHEPKNCPPLDVLLCELWKTCVLSLCWLGSSLPWSPK